MLNYAYQRLFIIIPFLYCAFLNSLSLANDHQSLQYQSRDGRFSFRYSSSASKRLWLLSTKHPKTIIVVIIIIIIIIIFHTTNKIITLLLLSLLLLIIFYGPEAYSTKILLGASLIECPLLLQIPLLPLPFLLCSLLLEMQNDDVMNNS